MHTSIKKIFVTLTILTCSQLVLAHEQNHKGEKPDPQAAIERMDTNGDGKLSENEVKGPLKKDFKMIDTNQDGFITLEELNNARPPQRKPEQ